MTSPNSSYRENIEVNLSRDQETLVSMIDLSQALAAARDLDTIMDIIRLGVRNLIGSDGATFVLREEEHCYYAEESAIQPLWKGRRFLLQECVSGWVMQNHKTAVIPDIYHDERIPKSVYEPTFVRSIVMVPIRSSNPLGAIGCYWAEPHKASDSEIQQLQILANMTAIAMENSNHLREVESKAKLLERAFEGTLQSISRMIDLCDAYTYGHQQHVGEIAYHIGQSMGLPVDHCQALNWICLVHDVGKIAIPAEILSKPAVLTQAEYKLVQTHSSVGYELLQDVNMGYPIAEIVLQHHERLDGSGYPQRLVADQILLDARILAVADVFEAMVSHRPYRPAHSYEVALSELLSHRGTKYDNHVVDTLVRLVRKEGFLIAQ